MNYTTPQENFWAGAFGDDYTDRNNGARWIASNLALFSRALSRTHDIKSVTELGANRGLNLIALRQLLPDARLHAVEINAKAVENLRQLSWLDVSHTSILDFKPVNRSDLVLIKGVLIHINPEALGSVYRVLDAASSRYLLIAEYYNPTPVSVNYRGHEERLFKRDFAGEMLRAHPHFKLIDYGFVYRGDPNFAQDDITWFLLEKQPS